MEKHVELRGKEGFWRFQDSQAGDELLPPPPYFVTDVYMSFIGVRFDRRAVRALLPDELSPVDGATGTICVYSVGAGWGVGPFSACYVAIEVEGHSAPDGSPGYYLATGHYSGRGYQMMNRYLNLNALKGGSRHYYEDDVAVGIGGPDGTDALTIRTRPGPTVPPTFAARHYMGRSPAGGTCLFAISANGIITHAEPLSVDIAENASEQLQMARPVELLYAAHCTELSMTFGPPRLVGGMHGAATSESSLFNAFAQIGRAAILVGPSRELRAINPMAEALIGDSLHVDRGQLAARRSASQAALAKTVEAALGGSHAEYDLDPIAIEREEGKPLIAQIMPVDNAVTGRPSALILLDDPGSEPSGSPVPALQLLGLTPHEARIAELVGSGLSPREAAEKLENSEGTVRTSLTRIYQKLDINRQSELARIVARL